MLVDTGGIGLLKGEQGGDDFAQEIVTQVQVALDDVDVILFVVSVHEGIVPMDLEVAGMLREAGKPVLLIINKVDTVGHDKGVDEFSELGFEHMFPVSALHDRGVDTPLGQAVGLLPKPLAKPVESGDEEDQAEAEPPMNIAIVGRPNVGKSSIINALTESQRVIVSEISGTTRDAIDVPFEVETDGVRQQYNLIDTAGIRKRRRIKDSVEFFSVNRSDKAIERCDLAVMVLDAAEGVTEQDKKICDKITEAGCACVVVVNKWDLYQAAAEKARKVAAKKAREQGGRKFSRKKQEEMMFEEFGQWVQSNMFFLDYAPVIFTSALDGFQLDRLLEAIRYVSGQLKQTLPTSLLNRALQEAIERNPAPSGGHRFGSPTLRRWGRGRRLFCCLSTERNCWRQLLRYLTGVLRKAFGFEGCNIRLVAKPRPKSIDPIRRTSVKKKTGKKASLREQSRLKGIKAKKKAARRDDARQAKRKTQRKKPGTKAKGRSRSTPGKPR